MRAGTRTTRSPRPDPVSPCVAPGLEPVEEALAGFAASDMGYSAQLVVHRGEEVVLDLTVGTGLQPDSLLPVFSCSKGAVGIVVALLVERGQLDLDAKVATYWPEFAQSGKGGVTVNELLSHQAGLVGVDGGFTSDELFAHEPLAKRLAEQRPFWKPGKAFLYHGLTIGTLADELVRRIDGRALAEVLREDVTGPRGIDLFLGTPASEDHRVAPFLPPYDEEVAAFLATNPAPDVDGLASVTSRGGALTILGIVNEVEFRRAGVPAAGVLATARGLAGLYAALRHEVGGQPPLISDDTVARVSQTQVFGSELGTGFEARFGVVFQVPFAPRWPFGSFRCFGHDGLGGSLAFRDPHYDISFGYTVQRMPMPGGMDARAVELTRVLRDCLAD